MDGRTIWDGRGLTFSECTHCLLIECQGEQYTTVVEENGGFSLSLSLCSGVSHAPPGSANNRSTGDFYSIIQLVSSSASCPRLTHKLHGGRKDAPLPSIRVGGRLNWPSVCTTASGASIKSAFQLSVSTETRSMATCPDDHVSACWTFR